MSGDGRDQQAQLAHKSKEELRRFFKHPELWDQDLLDAVEKELEKRGMGPADY